MDEAARRAAIGAMLGARSVAVVGASPRAGSFGERMIVEVGRSPVRMHLVNPRYSDVNGIACAPSLAAIDEEVDLALLGVPDSALLDQVRAAASAGVRSAVIFGSAVGESTRAQIASAATDAGMALCGGGCMGFINNVTGLRALGYLEPDPLPSGGVALITHSGSAFSTLLRARRGFGFRLAVSAGQELVSDTADYLHYALDDPGTTLVALLLETSRSAERLGVALRRAAEQEIPVVLLPVGHSPRGRSMVAAHSGALAGDDAGWSAFCARNGVIRVRNLTEMADTIELFEAGRRRRPGSHGIATVHDSGAERALCADLAHELDVEFAALSPGTLSTIGDLLEAGLTPTNPLDVWGTGAGTRELFGRCLTAMADDPAVAVAALAVDLVPEFDGDTSYPDAMRDVAGSTTTPLAVLASVPSAIDTQTADDLRADGIPVLEDMRSGIAALGHLAGWPLPVPALAAEADAGRLQRWTARLAADEWDAAAGFALLADYGIPVTASRTARDEAGVLSAAAEIGYPVVLKTVAAAHKTELQGVVLDIAEPEALRRAYSDMARRLGPAVSIDAQIPPGVEISVGVVRDPNFGPMLVIAAGGVMVELLADRVVALPPLTHQDALGLLRGLRSAALFDGWRGGPPVDIAALADVIAGFSTLATELGGHLDALEANPVIAGPRGAVAVDVLALPRR